MNVTLLWKRKGNLEQERNQIEQKFGKKMTANNC